MTGYKYANYGRRTVGKKHFFGVNPGSGPKIFLLGVLNGTIRGYLSTL